MQNIFKKENLDGKILKLCGMDYKLIFKTELLKKENSLSECDIPQSMIIFQTDIEKKWILPCLIHEVIEAVNFHRELGMEHKDICSLECDLTDIFNQLKK